MTVRAKLKLVSVTYNHYGAKVARFETCYDETIPEDQRFTKATPWGTFEMQVDNPAALEQLELGKDYYIDLTNAR